jgi:hypothetical protein
VSGDLLHTCPFEELLLKRVLGDATDDDRARLAEHVSQGCPTCAPRFQEEENLERLIDGAFNPLAEEVEKRRAPVLDRLRLELERDGDRRQNRRFRRLGMNALMFLTVLMGIALLSSEYLMFAAITKKLVRSQVVVAETEIHALVLALERHGRELQFLPEDTKAILPALETVRKDGIRIYYSVDRNRIKDGCLLDPWKNPYQYRRTAGGAQMWSMGPNGRDEQGLGDDISRALILIPR